MKPWRPESDADLAIFSKELAKRCIEQGCIPNKKVKMYDKFTIFKNEAPGMQMGFFDTDIGKDVSALMEKWSMLIYGPGFESRHVDFKMNISEIPFHDAIDVYKGQL